MILSKQSIAKLIAERGLVGDFLDVQSQLQPASFDLTLAKLFALKDAGKIDFDNTERKLSSAHEIAFDANGWAFLKQGVYKAQYNEVVRIPPNVASITMQRSSLMRCGVFCPQGFYDPGYEGRGETLVVVQNPEGISLKKNAKIAQMVFYSLNEGSESLYAGMHHKEHM